MTAGSAISFLSSADGDPGTGGGNGPIETLSFDSTGASIIVLVLCRLGAGGSYGTITDTYSNSWTALTEQNSGFWIATRIYYCLSPNTGTDHIITVGSSGSSYPGVTVAAFSGVTAYSAETGAVSDSPGSLGAVSAALYVSGFGHNDTTTPTINDGFTVGARSTNSGGNNQPCNLAYRIDASATAANPTWSGWSDSNKVSTLARFIP